MFWFSKLQMFSSAVHNELGTVSGVTISILLSSSLAFYMSLKFSSTSVAFSHMKRKGGLHQRLAAANEGPAAVAAQSFLATFLITEFAWGRMSPAQLQKFADLAARDVEQGVACLPQLKRLASIGCNGRLTNNMHRDLWRQLKSKPKTPPPTAITIPTATTEAEAGLLLPHTLFASMYEDYQDAFHNLLTPGGTSALQRFWSQCSSAPQFAEHPVFERQNYQRRCIPISIHGDEVPVVGRGKCWCKRSIVFSWYSVLAHAKPTLNSLFWIWACVPHLFKEGVGGTIQVFWEVLSWSLAILFAGTWPAKDHRGIYYAPGTPEYAKAGQPLAGGFFACLVSLAGDQDYMAKFLQQPHWASATRPCGFCEASAKGPLTYLDFREEAPWRSTIFSADSWSHDERRSQCPIFDLPGVSGLSVAPDYMHCKFLGYVQFLFGSVLYMLTHQILPLNPLANLHRVGLFIHTFQSRRATPNKFPVSAFRKLSIFVRAKGLSEASR